MNMKQTTYRIVRFTSEQSDKEILMSGITDGKGEGFNFRPTFELEVIRSQRETYHSEHCTDVRDWVFNVTENENNSSKVLMVYLIEQE
jgi:hypothetical protein